MCPLEFVKIWLPSSSGGMVLRRGQLKRRAILEFKKKRKEKLRHRANNKYKIQISSVGRRRLSSGLSDEDPA